MAIECGVIAALFAVIVVLFFRKKRNLWAWATLPLTLVPLCEFLLGLVFVELFSLTFSPFVRMIALVVAVACSCVWIGFISCAMKHKKKRITYIGITNLFNILLAAILIYNILPEIPA
ncbi:MAG: hypothetical protein E7485_09475 [Ruminococcaceae bacterium]|nr:hypothetical protein [Oscillospiraceae bacterium]